MKLKGVLDFSLGNFLCLGGLARCGLVGPRRLFGLGEGGEVTTHALPRLGGPGGGRSVTSRGLLLRS